MFFLTCLVTLSSFFWKNKRKKNYLGGDIFHVLPLTLELPSQSPHIEERENRMQTGRAFPPHKLIKTVSRIRYQEKYYVVEYISIIM